MVSDSPDRCVDKACAAANFRRIVRLAAVSVEPDDAHGLTGFGVICGAAPDRTAVSFPTISLPAGANVRIHVHITVQGNRLYFGAILFQIDLTGGACRVRTMVTAGCSLGADSVSPSCLRAVSPPILPEFRSIGYSAGLSAAAVRYSPACRTGPAMRRSADIPEKDDIAFFS